MVNEARRLRHTARILRAERQITASSREALERLLREAAGALASAGYDEAVLDNRMPGWRTSLSEQIAPGIMSVFSDAWEATARATIDPEPYATRHLESVWNRLVGVSDTTFDTLRLTIAEGRQAQEGIPQIAARIDALLGDSERWRNRAVTIARTEVIAANNAGALGSATATAGALGVPEGAVVKEWMATGDDRTRASHAAAHTQQVMGLDTPFSVGGTSLDYPGDPGGPGGEVINCRCTVLFHYPGDPDYPANLTTAPPPEPASMFTPDELTSALDPSRRRTPAAVRKELEATPAGADLAASIKGFTETRGGVANLRKNITSTLDGTASPAVARRTQAFLDAMNTYPTDQVPPLYRGFAVKVEDDSAAWWDAFEGQFAVGKRFNLNASSFSSSEKQAAQFAGMIGGTRRAGSNYTAVRFVMEGDTHALPVEALSKFKSEREWIAGGEFEVVGYTAATPAQPYYRVVIRQTKSLRKE